jgi:hypothetical protein
MSREGRSDALLALAILRTHKIELRLFLSVARLIHLVSWSSLALLCVFFYHADV